MEDREPYITGGNMPVFEIYDKKVIYTDGKTGAVLEAETDKWYPFRYFDDGNLDIGDDVLNTPYEAYDKAGELFT